MFLEGYCRCNVVRCRLWKSGSGTLAVLAVLRGFGCVKGGVLASVSVAEACPEEVADEELEALQNINNGLRHRNDRKSCDTEDSVSQAWILRQTKREYIPCRWSLSGLVTWNLDSSSAIYACMSAKVGCGCVSVELGCCGAF